MESVWKEEGCRWAAGVCDVNPSGLFDVRERSSVSERERQNEGCRGSDNIRKCIFKIQNDKSGEKKQVIIH
jgi:hypothetical protein